MNQEPVPRWKRVLALADWKGGEYGWCARLVESKGTKSVPREFVSSYLDVQIGDAARDKREDVRAALVELKDEWERTEGTLPPLLR